ncbi:MAG: alpha/beta hydrolase [Planctomycetaceae bacterium]|jgi:pimeloyl-ACP methyl ester carboxylesterase|nr:alpha/beta hydrolase [Planctomycetaceae bacterium]
MDLSNSTQSAGLHAAEFGEGAFFLAVHGFPFDHEMWLPLVSYLSDDCRLVFPDLRGFGKTPLPVSRVTTMRQFAEDLRQFLTQKKPTSRIVICGLSMGGYVALHFARMFPECLSGLILCDMKAAADLQTAADNRRRRADALPTTGLSALADAMIPNLFAPAVDEEKIQKVRRMILRQSVNGTAAADRGMAERPDMTDWLPEIHTPTLVVCGEQDQISTPAEMKTIAERLPSADFATIPNAGHLSPLESPEVFAAHVKDFLKKIS